MAGGLAALLDDIAMIAKLTSAAGTKAVGVVVDDTAVTPRYVQGFSPARELPIIWQIAKGSLVNKIVFILPAALLLSQFAPWLLTPILMLGGTYLCYEGAEKLWEIARRRDAEVATGAGGVEADANADPAHEDPAEVVFGPEHEKAMVRGAITTDFILSAEIMVISLDQVATAPFVPRAITLVLVAIAITALVYGVCALIVKTDDIGLALVARGDRASQRLGAGLVRAMPVVMSVLSNVGIVAMLWVGGHILVQGAHTLGWHLPHDLLHHLTEPVSRLAIVGSALAWLVDTLGSAVVGVLVGAVVVGALHLLPLPRRGHH